MRDKPNHFKPLTAAGPTPMLVLAGLPKSVANATAGTVKNKFGWQAVTVPFEEHGSLYSSEKALCALLRQVCEFAKSQSEKDTSSIPAPSRIVLAYVRDGFWKNLLSAFGYSVAAGPLNPNSPEWVNGKHWRHRVEDVTDAVERFLGELNTSPLKAIRLRVESPKSSEPLVLPPRNFMVSKNLPLSELFDGVMDDPSALEVIDALKPQQFIREKLQTYYSKVGGRDKKYQIDSRKLVFPFSNNGNHAPLRENDFPDHTTIGEFRMILETAYRFGSPLKLGFQHDVQFENDRHLRNEAFTCSEKGPTKVSGSHANVYPNDTIR